MFFYSIYNSTTDISPLSLHDALPIYRDYVIGSLNADKPYSRFVLEQLAGDEACPGDPDSQIATMYLRLLQDRKSTRLNSSHLGISYAVFCLKKKKQKTQHSKSISKTE